MSPLLQSSSQRSVLIMLLSLFFFAANVVLLRWLSLQVPEADGWIGILFRGTVGLGFILALYGGSRGLVLRHAFTHRKLVARGIVGAVATLLFYITIVHLGASRAIIINLSYPLFGVIIAAVWLKESLTLRVGTWILTGFAGLVLFFSDAAFDRGLSFYDFIAILGAVGSGIAVVFIRGLSRDHHPSTIYGAQCVYCMLLTIPVAGTAAFTLPPIAWFILILGAILVSCGQLSITIAFRHLSVARGTSIQMLLPFLTAAGAFLVLGERLALTEILGAALTIFATWQVLRSPAPTPSVSNAPGAPAHPCPSTDS